MLQEDFSNELKKALCWYACHMHWKVTVSQSSVPDSVETEEEVQETAAEEEEEVEVENLNSTVFVLVVARVLVKAYTHFLRKFITLPDDLVKSQQHFHKNFALRPKQE